MTPEEACNFPLDLENHYGYVYCMTFPNGKKYVGQSSRPWMQRWHCHKAKDSGCIALRNALAKYGACNATWEILSYASSQDELNLLECTYIEKLQTLSPNGYNLKDGGEGHIYAQESKEKMRLSCTAFFIRKNLSTDGSHQLTEAEILEIARNKVIEKKKKLHIDTGFNIISFLTTGNENICILPSQYNSIIHNRETYQDPIRGAEIRKKLHQKQKALRSRPILCVETGEVFSCTTEALEKHPEWNRSKINACCSKLRRSHHNLHFRYNDLSEKDIREFIDFWYEPIKTL